MNNSIVQCSSICNVKSSKNDLDCTVNIISITRLFVILFKLSYKWKLSDCFCLVLSFTIYRSSEPGIYLLCILIWMIVVIIWKQENRTNIFIIAESTKQSSLSSGNRCRDNLLELDVDAEIPMVKLMIMSTNQKLLVA